MSIRIYTDIVSDESNFSIIESEHKKEGAFVVLRRIEKVISNGLKYSAHGDDKCSKMSHSELIEELKLKAKSIRNGYLNKCHSISPVRRFFGGVSKKEQNIQSVYERIHNLTHLSTPLSIAIPRVETSSVGECFLTGKVETQNLEVGSPELYKNLEAAKRIIEHVQNTIFYSSNYPQRSKVMRKFAKQARIDPAFQSLYKDNMKTIKDRLRTVQRTDIDRLSSLRDYFTQNRVGNCGEMAPCGLEYARQLPISAEQWYIQGGNHTFLVLGRSQSSWWSDYQYWDYAAVICDPWSGCLFPATHLEMYLKNFVTLSKRNGVHKTKIESFDPHKHTLLRRA